jgi:hypothetical protein
MSEAVDLLLDKLEAVRCVANGRWRARCPAHNGENPGILSIAETGDGTVLLKCFHGCSAEEVTRAVGLELHDLFPAVNWRAHGAHHARPARRPRVDWAGLIQAMEKDLLLLKILLADVDQGRPPALPDRIAAGRAATRLYALVQEARDG